MICPTCGRENRDKANFCRYCGTHFALACPRCRTVLVEDSIFCDNCGLQIKQLPEGSLLPAATPQPISAPPITTPVPAPPQPTPVLSQPSLQPVTQAAPAQSLLQQYIPKQLMD